MKQILIRSKTYAESRYLIHLVDPSFQGVNRRFVLSSENEDKSRNKRLKYYDWW